VGRTVRAPLRPLQPLSSLHRRRPPPEWSARAWGRRLLAIGQQVINTHKAYSASISNSGD